MTNTLFSKATVLFTGLALVASLFMFGALSASAATYAYVAANGEVKAVVANDWMTAIKTAPGIHIHSGVMLLKSATDFGMVGDDVSSI